MALQNPELIKRLEEEGFKPVGHTSRQQITATLKEILERDPNSDKVVDIRIIDSYHLHQLSEEGKFFADLYRIHKQGEKPPLDQQFTICFRYANQTES